MTYGLRMHECQTTVNMAHRLLENVAVNIASMSDTNETRLFILVESAKKTQSRSNDVPSGLPPSVPRSQHHDDEPVVPKQYGLYDTDEQPTKLRKVAVGPRGPTYKGRCMFFENEPGCACFQTSSCASNGLCRVRSSRHLCSDCVKYRSQRSCGKVLFSQACVKNSVHRGWGGVCSWQGGVHGTGVCVCGTGGGHVSHRGHAWHEGACMTGGACDIHAPQQLLRDTVNERAVRILLECILVHCIRMLRTSYTWNKPKASSVGAS